MADVMAPPEGKGVAGLEVVARVVAQDGQGQLDAVIARRPHRLARHGRDQGTEDLAPVGVVVAGPHYHAAARLRQGGPGARATARRLQFDEGSVSVLLHVAPSPVNTAPSRPADGASGPWVNVNSPVGRFNLRAAAMITRGDEIFLCRATGSGGCRSASFVRYGSSPPAWFRSCRIWGTASGMWSWSGRRDGQDVPRPPGPEISSGPGGR